MDIKEIINRPTPQTYNLDELIFVVEEYIFLRKKQRVNISVTPRMQIHNDLLLLNTAFDSACEWLCKNGYGK